jgi:peptidoglycan/xylan/chitin deacetylase (PgdA/CDA1 family)
MNSSILHKKIQQKRNQALNDLRTALGINEPFFKQARGARMLIYHGICRTDPTRFNSIFLRLKTFETHLRFYAKYFHLVSMDDYFHQRFHKDRFNICISFDDGFANNYKYVLPLLNTYKIPASFFVTAIRQAGFDILWNDQLGLAQKYGPRECRLLFETFFKNKEGRYVSTSSGKPLKDLSREMSFYQKVAMMKTFECLIPEKVKLRTQDFWMQMTCEEIRLLSSSPWATIGCHGYFHNDLSRMPLEEAAAEMQRSKEALELISKKKIESIAFPYGAYSRELVDKAKSIGFKQILAMDFLFPEDFTDKCMRERLTLNPYLSVTNQMIAIIKGTYEQ